MFDFFQALNEPTSAFLRYALLAGLLASVSLGVVGSYVVARRITYIAASIAHCVLGGVGDYATGYPGTVVWGQVPVPGTVIRFR